MKHPALEKALLMWESKEYAVEQKLEALKEAIFLHVGLKEPPDHYMDHGNFLERYTAGFISGFFWRLNDISFILLDPLHIFDIITTFVKVLFTHPLKMLKQIWSVWTWNFIHGAFGLGNMTSSILLAFLMAASATVLVEGVAAGVASATSTVPQSLVGQLTYIPSKVAGIAQGVKQLPTYVSSLFSQIQKQPQLILAHTQRSLTSGVAYGQVRELKFYANPFLKRKAVSA